MSERIPIKDFFAQLPAPPPPPASPSGDHQTCRRAVLRCTPEILIWMGSGIFEVVANPLPSDAQIVGAFYDGERHTFAVVVESESFAPVEGGDLLPDLTAPTIRRLPVFES